MTMSATSRSSGAALVCASLLTLCLWASPTLGCMPDGASNSVEIGKDTFVCLVINDQHLMMLTPKADEFFRFDLENSYAYANTCRSPYGTSTAGTDADQSCPTSLYLESMGVRTTYKKQYTNSDRSLFFPTLTAVITVVEGLVEAVFWDDGCWFCDENDTEDSGATGQVCANNAYDANDALFTSIIDENTGIDCALDTAECDAQIADNPDARPCDMRLYVVWSGTDSNGKYFSSAGSRLRVFTQYALPDMKGFISDL